MVDSASRHPAPAVLREQDRASREIAHEHARAVGGSAQRRLRAAEPYVTEAELARVLPSQITKIFLITGPQSEALEDFRGALHQPQRRLVQPVFVALRTLDTPQEVAAALRRTPTDPGHVVVIARGGGDRGEDLWAFDHPTVVRAIVDVDVPVVTALGHRGNISWADRVATAALPVPGDLGSAMRRLLAQQYYARRRAAASPGGPPGRAAPTRPSDAPSDRPRGTAGPYRPAPQPTRSEAPRPTPSAARATPPTPPAARAAPPNAPYRPMSAYPDAPHWSSPTRPRPAPRVRRTRPSGPPRGLGVASLVLGIVAAFAFGGFGVLPLVGLVLGLCDVRRRPRKAAIAGIIVNGSILLGSLVSLALLLVAGTATTNAPS